jgi:hypothetical protein
MLTVIVPALTVAPAATVVLSIVISEADTPTVPEYCAADPDEYIVNFAAVPPAAELSAVILLKVVDPPEGELRALPDPLLRVRVATSASALV